MPALQFPSYDMEIKQVKDKSYVFDLLRRKFILLTPEEWVRQHVLRYLHQEKQYPLSWMAVEYITKIHGHAYRADLVVFDRSMKPTIMVECKASHIDIDEATIRQIMRYNIEMQAPYLFVTNGLTHYGYQWDNTQQSYQKIEALPNNG